MTMCNYCGAENANDAQVCGDCGKSLIKKSSQSSQNRTSSGNEAPAPVIIPTPSIRSGIPYANVRQESYSDKSRVTAGLLGIFAGCFGLGRIYLGYTGLGIAQILVTMITFGIGSIWGFIDGIVILAGGVKKDGRGYKIVK